MKKIPGQSKITKSTATAIGARNRDNFLKIFTENASAIVKSINQSKTIAMEVASFSSFNDFPEQVLSILSFIKHVGTPIKWTVYSDGSHSDEQIKLLKLNFNFVNVCSIDFSTKESLEELCRDELKPYHTYILDYANNHAFGKRLFYYLNHSLEHPTLFIDSDILFYEKSNIFEMLINENPKADGWFMPDAFWGCLDSRYKAAHSEQMYQVNAGFMFVLKPFEKYNKALDFYKILESTYEYFSEQTIINILLKDNNFMPLPSNTFILDSADQFDFSYLYNPRDIAVRHYTGPVRHKMWQKDYKWHLSL
ncbi:hypothetical protein FFWV33_12080 [Flavobacterium faecale]|uniref:Glycosyl transferase n=1 Tax=Flavobacterium faecale TaxID=1355330 RepID=A0A2S1LES6_9FLAO|nr:hypothetical protein [Flavobacterium faecale]AWG22199.1 hypothetical protein FFWV33_12080 [Flavobacterium faecale]